VIVTAPQITSLDVEYAAANRGQHRSPKRSAAVQARNDAALAAMLATPVRTNGHAVAQSVSGLSSLHASVKAPSNGLAKTKDQTTDQRPAWDHGKKIAVLRVLRSQRLTRNQARDRLGRIGQGFNNDDWTEAGL
jgi:hypothetical protein